jgi:hypothetical protein
MPGHASGHRVEASRIVAVEPELAFDRLISAPLTEIFSRRFAAFPAIREVRDQPESWGVVGQTRTIVLTDGGRLRETLTEVDRPRSYSYVLDEINGPLRPFVTTVDGTWAVTAEGEGSMVGWSWTLHPKRAPGRLTMNVLGRMWKGYAERGLAELETILTRG